MNSFKNLLTQLRSYPSAVIGLAIILGMVIFSITVVIVLPYERATFLWRGSEETWLENPRLAPPAWINWFRSDKLPETLVMDSRTGDIPVSREARSETIEEITLIYEFDFEYDAFPRNLSLFIYSRYQEKAPSISMTWFTPDGREIRVGQITPNRNSDTYVFDQDATLRRRLNGQDPQQALFLEDPEAATGSPLKGTYTLVVTAIAFEPDTEVEAKFVSYGQVHGVAGTDHRRRDLSVALMWGAPIALAFGLLAAVGSTTATLIIAAVGVWVGGVVDDVIQRITEVNLILPVLPILIMVGTLYNRSIWVMLIVVVLLGIFGAGIKTFRAIFLQVKNAPYIEAARSYGASNTRIVFRYLIPRVLPVLIPQFVVLVPSLVFLEAAIAVLGLGDPILPTWGKVISEARNEGALFNGQYYWMIEPAVMLMITGIGFSMLGFSLDRIFNPRLRDV